MIKVFEVPDRPDEDTVIARRERLERELEWEQERLRLRELGDRDD